MYLQKSGSKHIGTKANLVIAAAAGACTAIVTQVRQNQDILLLLVFIYSSWTSVFQNFLFVMYGAEAVVSFDLTANCEVIFSKNSQYWYFDSCYVNAMG